MSSASDGDGRGACGAQGLPVGPPSSGSVRSSGSRVRNWEPHGGWDSSLLSSFLLPGGAIGMLRGGDPPGDGGQWGGGAEKGASLSPACGQRKETGDENGWGAGGPGQLGVVTAGPLLALFSVLRWETTFSFPFSVPCVSHLPAVWAPRAPGAPGRGVCVGMGCVRIWPAPPGVGGREAAPLQSGRAPPGRPEGLESLVPPGFQEPVCTWLQLRRERKAPLFY